MPDGLKVSSSSRGQSVVTPRTDARLQLHHAAQLCAAFGISYLAAQEDDSHTSFRWDSGRGAMMSGGVMSALGTISVGLRVADLTIVVTRDHEITHTIRLHGTSVSDAAKRLAVALSANRLYGERLTLQKHYTIPAHPVADGAPFDGSDTAAFIALHHWFDTGARALLHLAAGESAPSELCIWPHHFDLAVLFRVSKGSSNGAGLVPGDEYYDEPYFYVNASPMRGDPVLDPAALKGSGFWHTHQWTGAVLPASRLAGDAQVQRAQIDLFLASALAACRSLL
jgi:hypothetical protein